jgi:peptide deformylase
VILKICQAGETSLRQFARPLSRDEILSAPMQELIVAMRDTMRDAPGVGLAAPQIGLPLQIAVIEDTQEVAVQERAPVPFHVIVNPRIELHDEPVEHFEGCLSLAGFRAVVPRARAVTVECLNERAEPVTIRARGWYARILQHEIDHLHGMLYIDRMYPRSFMTQDNFARYWKDAAPAAFRPGAAE